MPDAGGNDGYGGDDPQGAFDKSLGDFDGEIARERETMASAGQGTGRAAEGRETGDAGAVRSAGQQGSGRVGAGDAGGMAGAGDAGADVGGAAGETAGAGAAGNGAAEQAGSGQPQPDAAQGGGTEGGAQQPGAAAADIPDDIPADGSGEDQVARQLREAAMAEKDPVVREALWEQYRRHTGLTRK